MSRDYPKVRLILGDQLNASHSWFRGHTHETDDRTLFVIMEMKQELTYVKHHIQKVVGFFAAMRNFAQAISKKHDVLYLKLDSSDNQQDLCKNLQQVCSTVKAKSLEYQEPDEYRLDTQLKNIDWITTQVYSSEHFYTERDDLKKYFPDAEHLLMEKYYRQARKETGYLMNGNKPLGGKWNYDSENRNKIPKKHEIHSPLMFSHDVSDLVDLLNSQSIETFGEVDSKHFLWPISRKQAIDLMDYFFDHLFQHFGEFQDALTDRGWSLYHSRISFALNTKMVSPKYVVERAIQAYEHSPESISLPQVEGFVRQILGWREYVRMIYWRFMPEYANRNELNHTRDLPSFYWSGKTNMRCVSHAVSQSLKYAYAHHIQRLMVTGNFALLAGIDPQQVDDWYLGIYIDAIEWVELPNTRGMSQFADGGVLATKPYVSGGNYIKKMGDHCTKCTYDVSKKYGDNSCPFNSLYWHFIDKHEDKFRNNHRMRMMYAQWDKRTEQERQDILQQAEHYLEHIEDL
ncbi:cryptochrome/photolyase family protein [Lysobacter sp. N42]|nr:cryptochrome/photolyase family protein [Aliidiomarina sp. B3213]TCZ93399.1 cryptochrome/photolyase family protein [Lysobacter sp. N42]